MMRQVLLFQQFFSRENRRTVGGAKNLASRCCADRLLAQDLPRTRAAASSCFGQDSKAQRICIEANACAGKALLSLAAVQIFCTARTVRSGFFFLSALLVISLLSVALVPSAYAVGFANLPITREFIVEPGFSMDIPLTVIDGERLTVGIVTTTPDGTTISLGDAIVTENPTAAGLAPYIALDDPAPGTGPRTVRLRVSPTAELTPSKYYITVAVSEAPPDGAPMIAAMASARLRFTLWVLSPDKRIEITSVEVPDIAEGTKATTNTTIISRTKQDIGTVYADVQLFRANEIVASGKSPSFALPSTEQVVLTTHIDTTTLAGGEYNVSTRVMYDGAEEAWRNEILKIGTLHVGIPEYTKNFTFNQTNKYSFKIGNQWNRELSDVYAVVKIGGSSKKTPSQSVAAFGSTDYDVYYDRDESLRPGTVPVEIAVTYQDYNSTQRKYVQRQEGFNLTLDIVERAPEKTAGSLLVPLVAGGVILILIILIIIILLQRRRREPPVPVPDNVTPAAATPKTGGNQSDSALDRQSDGK